MRTHQEVDRSRTFRRRALLLGGVQLAVFGALAARLYRLQVQDGAAYALLAEDNRISERLLVPPRGRILDRRGRLLARNLPSYRLRLARDRASDLRASLDRLAGLVRLPPAEIDGILEAARRVPHFVPLLVREDLSWDEVARVAIRAPDLPDVLLEAGLVRDYPEGEILAHLLGYVAAVDPAEQAADADPLLRLPEFRIGKSGIERSYDRRLRGQAGVSRVEVNASGREIRELDRRAGASGDDLRLSLDLGLQRFCAARLSSELAASAVVLEVATGAVVAMASVPSYDPATFTSGLSRGVWGELRDNKRTPLVNKCIRGQYPPGSTFKMMTALAGLEAGLVTPASGVSCRGHVNLGRARFHCWREKGHGSVSLIQALGQSCDVYFYELARRVGIDRIAAMAQRFGLGAAVGLDLPGEQPGLIPRPAGRRRPWASLGTRARRWFAASARATCWRPPCSSP